MHTYKMNIVGLERELPVCKINDKLSIAAFIMFSDVELTVASAEQLLKKVPEFDIIITPEAKGIPLAYEMARQSGKKYIVIRKSAKLYMREPISIEVKSISTDKVQTLFLDKQEAESIKGKRVLIVDDVISTGESINAVKILVDQSGGIVAGKCSVLAEGDAAEFDDIIYLEYLPINI